MNRSIRSKLIATGAVLLGALGLAQAAQARTDVFFSVGIPAPVYVEPAPVYVPPAPVYVPPRTVYVDPAPGSVRFQLQASAANPTNGSRPTTRKIGVNDPTRSRIRPARGANPAAKRFPRPPKIPTTRPVWRFETSWQKAK